MISSDLPVFSGFPKPHKKFTQTPNILYDELANTLDLVELRIILLLIRKTYGWRKSSMVMSVDSIADIIRYGRSSTKAAIARLDKAKLLIRVYRKTDCGASSQTDYRLRFSGEEDAKEEPEVGARILAPTGQAIGPSPARILAPLIRSKEQLLIKDRTIPLPPFKNQNREQPAIDIDDVLILHKRSKGVKSPGKPEVNDIREWMGRHEDPPAVIHAAMTQFLADDFWRESRFPLSAFRKQYAKYRDSVLDATEAEPLSVDTAPVPIVTPRSSQPPKTPIVASAPDPVSEFIAAWQAGPCADLRVPAPDAANIQRGLRACLKIPAFRENQATIISKAHTLRAKGQTYINLEMLLREEKWAKLLNGGYDWIPSAGNGRGGRHDVTSGPDALARFQAKNRLKIQEQREKEKVQAS